MSPASAAVSTWASAARLASLDRVALTASDAATISESSICSLWGVSDEDRRFAVSVCVGD
ncbi:MAG: hypothetical protein M3492_08810 [Actinomycetota bacterium]|nr:hypothetical protein [Actinomycetota bacterium]